MLKSSTAMGKILYFDGILQQEGWLKNIYVTVSEQGQIESISQEKPTSDISIEHVEGYAIPGFQNAHSHAFQYAMAGLAEVHASSGKDDFWSWRSRMYEIALGISPDQLEAVATMLYAEMVRHGYTNVAEFHYLHHDSNGKAYGNLAEMGERLVAAAQRAGIKITLIPIFYQKGGFGKEAQHEQRRFLSKTIEDYHQLITSTQQAMKGMHHANCAVGIHSLRAVDAANIVETFDAYDKIPLHIHISEQLKEIEDCLAFYGQRPVEWLMNTTNLHENCHLVHATHINTEETLGIAKSGAHVVLCPSTEGNLGDGLFPLESFQNNGGHWSIGTDSHIGLNPLEELRWLDYGQRLTKHQRNNFTSDVNGNSGSYAVHQALMSGRKAMGNETSAYFEVGQSLDAAVIDAQTPLIQSCREEMILPTLIYAGDPTMLLGTMVCGKWIVRESMHAERDEIRNSFTKAVRALGIR